MPLPMPPPKPPPEDRENSLSKFCYSAVRKHRLISEDDSLIPKESPNPRFIGMSLWVKSRSIPPIPDLYMSEDKRQVTSEPARAAASTETHPRPYLTSVLPCLSLRTPPCCPCCPCCQSCCRRSFLPGTAPTVNASSLHKTCGSQQKPYLLRACSFLRNPEHPRLQ